jgi:MFS family permease
MLILNIALSCVSTWFLHKRGIAYGLTVSGSSLGGVIFPILMDHLIREIGFPWAMRTAAFMILAFLSLSIVLVRARTQPIPKPVKAKDFVHALGDKAYMWLAIGASMFIFGFFIPVSFVIVEAIHGGMSPDLASYLVSMLNGARYVSCLFSYQTKLLRYQVNSC